jgi:hypothetical protein
MVINTVIISELATELSWENNTNVLPGYVKQGASFGSLLNSDNKEHQPEFPVEAYQGCSMSIPLLLPRVLFMPHVLLSSLSPGRPFLLGKNVLYKNLQRHIVLSCGIFAHCQVLPGMWL